MQLWRRCVANWGVIHQWEKRSLHIQQVILTFYLTFFWGNIEKITKMVQYKIARSYSVSASSWDNTSFVLHLIQKPPKSALKLRGPFSPVLAIASLQLIGDGVFEQFLAVPQPECWGWLSQLPSLKLHQWSLLRVWRCTSVHGMVYKYIHICLSKENFPLESVVACSAPPSPSSPMVEQGERSFWLLHGLPPA